MELSEEFENLTRKKKCAIAEYREYNAESKREGRQILWCL
jgi:hypothetical protein